MKMTQGTMESWDVMVDDGGVLYRLRFQDGVETMTRDEVVSDFMSGYDGDISKEEIEVIFPDDI